MYDFISKFKFSKIRFLLEVAVALLFFSVNGLAEDLVSFPMEKSLLCMRQIRKYMDEKLIGLEGSIQNSEVDTNVT